MDAVRPDAENARRHSDRNLRAIRASLERHGQQKAIVASEDGTVLAGNGTLAAVKDLGWREVAVTTFERHAGETDEEYRARCIEYALADNRTGELAEWHPDVLHAQLDYLRDRGVDLERVLAFNQDEIHNLIERELSGRGSGVDQDAEIEAKAKPVTVPGDLWDFPTGHRLLCGDSTAGDNWKRLMDGRVAAAVFTDPPYGVKYVGGAREGLSDKWEAIANDDLQGAQLADFLERALRPAVEHTEPRGAFYIWHASATREAFVAAMKAAGLEEKQYLMWVKPHHTLGRSHYHYQHEPCFYAVRKGQSPAFYAERDQTTTWLIGRKTPGVAVSVQVGTGVVIGDGSGAELYIADKPPKKRKVRRVRLEPGTRAELQQNESVSDVWFIERETGTVHPTQKPVELAARALRNSTKDGDVVLDMFLGSGTTLIAAEQLGRRCYGFELDPSYCDAIIERYVELTGKRPVNQDGREWARREA